MHVSEGCKLPRVSARVDGPWSLTESLSLWDSISQQVPVQSGLSGLFLSGGRTEASRGVRHCLQMRGATALVLLLDGWHAFVDNTTPQREGWPGGHDLVGEAVFDWTGE